MTYTPLPVNRAQSLLTELCSRLDQYHAMDWETEGKVSTDYLFSPARGHMLGVLLARDASGSPHILKAFSGQYDGRWVIPGWVPPCLDPAAWEDVKQQWDKSLSSAEANRQCLEAYFNLYRFSAIDGSVLTLRTLFPQAMPPVGTGDCCAPKLLSYCFSQGWLPVSMAECFYGRDNASGTRIHKECYPPCQERCRPLIKGMLGIDVVYADDAVVVVDKPAGLLSVPGIGEEKQDCVEKRVTRLFPLSIVQPSVHRLDMDTSGLLVYGLTRLSQSGLSRQFAEGKIHKQYIAVVDGILKEKGGTINLAIRQDREHRPYQVIDPVGGKQAVTDWENLGVFDLSPGRVVTRVRFTPHTGRTHQLRVHSRYGLGIPIVGDRLYGTRAEGERLMLHASFLSFVHPATHQVMEFTSPAPF
ncbi:MAG: RluA family pseudouridine synthase [Sphaerochaeta sp.]|nr:RluA family pseudouridine synthase [Sphaerochaeta sp.]